jgi:hypothetical protein
MQRRKPQFLFPRNQEKINAASDFEKPGNKRAGFGSLSTAAAAFAGDWR